MNILCRKLQKTIDKIEQTLVRLNGSDHSKEDTKYIENVDFAIAESIIDDFGKSWSLQIAYHIIAHYVLNNN